jgi:hypothetical protein
MSQITFVRIVIGDAIKKTPGDQYSNSRKAEVELHSTVEEGDNADAVLDNVRLAAQIKVEEILSGASSPRKTAGDTPSSPPPSSSSASEKSPAEITEETPKKAATKSRKGRPPGAKNKKTVAKAKAKAADAAAIVDVPAEFVGGKPELPEVDDGQDMGLDDILGIEVPVAEISDADLGAETMKKNESLDDPKRIRELIGTFVDYDDRVPKVRDIPQAKRQAFLDALAELKPAE